MRRERAAPLVGEPANGSDLRRDELEDALRRITIEVSSVGFAAPLPVVSRHQAWLRQPEPRQREIVMLLLQRHRVPAIARLLSTEPGTVRNHLKRVFKQLGVRSQQELLLFFQGEAAEPET